MLSSPGPPVLRRCSVFFASSAVSGSLRSSGQRRRIKEREKREREEGRGREVRRGCAMDAVDTRFCPVVECGPGPPMHTEGTI